MNAKFWPAWKDVAAELTAIRSLGFDFDFGLEGRLDFWNHEKPMGDSRTTARFLYVKPVPAGASMPFPKPLAPEGLGGSPWITPQCLKGDGFPIGSEALLGRRVQLAPGN